ncbi:esterase-5B-like [Episyrphus balteatus]|uniref:esterase-5B-like n=1 Tax=Episyrphus balteatus TaxID=286459 RepID=UPI0024858104|nr:esterase-5B-like [Episyrphus balteatus]
MEIHRAGFSLFNFLVLISKCFSESEPVVTLPFGKIRGIHADGNYKFHNIPFAEPPVGKHRFEPPIPYKQNWDKELDGTQPIIKCINFEKDMETQGNEDCLYLHVATPDISCEKLYPVRIQIHPGAYAGGSPDNVEISMILNRGIVIVTMGYRLGPLGFLSTGDKVISGNNGLKDQQLAIMWVKANIKNFCGDDNNILLAGVSAGGACTHMHLLHKSTEKYVNAVESHNGAATNPWGLEPDPKWLSKTYANLLNCPSDSSESMKACFQGKTIDELRQSMFALKYYENNPFTVFVPVVESSDSENPFITQHPDEIMRNGQAANLTWFVGYTEREGTYNSAAFLRLNKDGVAEIEMLNNHWDEMAPILMFFNRSMKAEERVKYSKFLKDKFLGKNKFSVENYRLLENMYTDALFNDEIKKSILLHRKYGPGRVYAYFYKYPHKYGVGNLISQRNDISFGADHSADTIFIIPKKNLKQKEFSDKDKKFSGKLLDMHINWANTGVLRFGEKDLPLSTPTDDAIMIFNENCYSVDGCTGESEGGCSCYPYD